MFIQSGLVEKLAFGGSGIVRHEGKVVFVPLVLPAEEIEYEITLSKKSHAFGNLLKVIQPSADRIEPKCEYYGRCGGCQLQHIPYGLQLKFKHQWVSEAFYHLHKTHDFSIQPVIGTDKQWHYRRRIRLHQRGKELGFMGLDGHTFVPVTHCEIYSGQQLDLDDDIFVQAHPEQSERLYADIEASIPPLKKGGQGGFKILDLYCGIGTLTSRLAAQGHEITAIELNAKAITWAKANHPPGPKWIVADVAEVITPTLTREKPSVVLVNPPRTGMHPKVTEALAKHKPKHIFYTSCMPSTLARDLKILCDAGYRIQKCQPYDLFPQTTHVETVVHLCAP